MIIWAATNATPDGEWVTFEPRPLEDLAKVFKGPDPKPIKKPKGGGKK